MNQPSSNPRRRFLTAAGGLATAAVAGPALAQSAPPAASTER
ncbi:FAD-dependent pyridine nucleotide-disulfide oxidoreductase, partial [Thauera aminoaromatica S2]